MSYTHKVQVATLNGVDHLLLVQGDLEVLLDEYQVGRDEVTIRDMFLSPWADDVIQHGLKAIAPAPVVGLPIGSFSETNLVSAEIGGLRLVGCNEQQLELVRDQIDPAIPVVAQPVYTACYRELARGIKTLSGDEPWHHDTHSIAMHKLDTVVGDISAGMDYGVATTVAFKTTMVVNQEIRVIMAIALIGKSCDPALIVTSWHDPINSDCDRFFDCLEEAGEAFEIECHVLKVIIAMDALVQAMFVAGTKPWPGIEI